MIGYSGEPTPQISWPCRCVRSLSSSFPRTSTRPRAVDFHNSISTRTLQFRSVAGAMSKWQRPWHGGSGGSGTPHFSKGGNKGGGKGQDT
eukprot:8169622-Pyramimonas_sp.AAC.1